MTSEYKLGAKRQREIDRRIVKRVLQAAPNCCRLVLREMAKSTARAGKRKGGSGRK